MKYRKRPVVIDAVQWWTPGDDPRVEMRDGVPCIHSIEGWHEIKPGYWIVTGVKGEHYGVRPDIFEQTYEPAE